MYESSPDEHDDRFAEMLRRVVQDRLASAAAEIPSRTLKELKIGPPQWLTRLTFPRRGRLVVGRRRLASALPALLLFSLLDCFLHIGGVPSAVSALTILGGSTLMILVLLEIVLGAGIEAQMKYKFGDTWEREYEFTPSITRFDRLAGLLGLGLASVVLGFAGMHGWAAREIATSYSETLSGVSSIYFSIVTFATVGFGDIRPLSQVGQILVSLEILLSWVLVVIVLTTCLSWMHDYRLIEHEKFIERRRLLVQTNEDLIRSAELGRYGKVEDLYEEARRRIEEEDREGAQDVPGQSDD